MLDFKFFYQRNKNVVPVAGQYIQGNILLVSDDNHIIVKKDKFVSTPINTNAFGISTFIEFKFKERMIELVLETIISLVAQDLNIYTKIIKFSHPFILYNTLKFPIEISIIGESMTEIIGVNEKK